MIDKTRIAWPWTVRSCLRLACRTVKSIDLLNDHHHAGLSAPNLVSLQFCLKLSRRPLSVCSKDIEALQACGFDDESILEAVVVTALAVYRCTLSVGLGPEPDFESRKIASTRFVPPLEGAPHGLWPNNHEAGTKKRAISSPLRT